MRYLAKYIPDSVKYWGRVLIRAAKDTKSFFGWKKRNLAYPLTLPIGFLIYWVLRGEDAVRDELWLIISFLVGPIAFTLFLFLWNLVAAPPRMERDAAKTAESAIEEVRQELGFAIQQREQLRKQVIERKAINNQRMAVDGLIAVGNRLRAEIKDCQEGSQPREITLKVTDWLNGCKSFLYTEVPWFVGSFMNESYGIQGQMEGPMWRGNLVNYMERRLGKLGELLAKL